VSRFAYSRRMIPRPPLLPSGSFGATGRWRAAAALAIALAASGPVAGQDADSRLPAPYLTALASYRAGDLAAAFRKLQELDESEVTEITRRLMRPDVAGGSSWPKLLTAAILLHTEAFLIREEAGRSPFGDVYLLTAHSLVRRLLALAREGQPGVGEAERMLARDWYLLLASAQHGSVDVGRSRAFLEEALKFFPKDAHLTLALGADHEMLSDRTAGYVTYFDTEGRFRRLSEVDADDELAEAIRYMERAVALDPKDVEGRLRLGRLLYRRGDLDWAAQELDAARQLTSQDELRYLALVFRGMVESARGQYERADGFYTAALRLIPTAQSAAIAKAETAYLRGRVGEAAATIQATLQQAKKDDPWWVYMIGEWWHLEHRLGWIRKYVQQ
jgi:tetratricopeptide (TPR) repeat protein